MSRGVGVKSIWPSLGALCVLLCRTRGARENTEGCGAWLLGASARRAVLAFCFPGAIGGDLGSARPWQLAGCKTLAARGNKMCSRLSTVQFANGPKRSMGHVLGAKKDIFFNSRPRAPYGLWRPRRLNPVNPCPRGLPGAA